MKWHYWECPLCHQKKYQKKGSLVRHLVGVHRKRMFEDGLTGEKVAEKIADKGYIEDNDDYSEADYQTWLKL